VLKSVPLHKLAYYEGLRRADLFSRTIKYSWNLTFSSLRSNIS
jgi:hypothetical protein